MILDYWIREKHGLTDRAAYEAALPELLSHAVNRARTARFYEGYPAVQTLSDFEALPFITADDLRKSGARMLCVTPDRIRRIVTGQTSGTTGEPKRVFFTEDDLERTLDYFSFGLRLIAHAGEPCAVCMPCEHPDGVGDLIARGLERLGAIPVRAGMPRGAAALPPARSAVGSPVQLLGLCELLRAEGRPLPKRVLLSSDYVPRAILARLRALGVEPYEHFGMTETGYGCAIDCAAHDGMHIRENDLYLEVIREGGNVFGEWGELAITTLNSEAMPLLRYRTGDTAKLTRAACACGSWLARLWVRGRDAQIAALDETLFAFPGVMDYSARRTQAGLDVAVYYIGTAPKLPAIPGARVSLSPFSGFQYSGKRRIEPMRG